MQRTRASKQFEAHFTCLYFKSRSQLPYGEFKHVTFTPTGPHVTSAELFQRVESAMQKCKGIDLGLFIHEVSSAGVNHLHGFLHQATFSKLTKLVKDTLLVTLFAKKGNPEGWIHYMFKDNPLSALFYSQGKLRKINQSHIVTHYLN